MHKIVDSDLETKEDFRDKESYLISNDIISFVVENEKFEVIYFKLKIN